MGSEMKTLNRKVQCGMGLIINGSKSGPQGLPNCFTKLWAVVGILCFALGGMSCSEDADVCIASYITTFIEDHNDCSGASIRLYSFNGESLYGFLKGSCDEEASIDILNENCNIYCTTYSLAMPADSCSREDLFFFSHRIRSIWVSE